MGAGGVPGAGRLGSVTPREVCSVSSRREPVRGAVIGWGADCLHGTGRGVLRRGRLARFRPMFCDVASCHRRLKRQVMLVANKRLNVGGMWCRPQ